MAAPASPALEQCKAPSSSDEAERLVETAAEQPQASPGAAAAPAAGGAEAAAAAPPQRAEGDGAQDGPAPAAPNSPPRADDGVEAAAPGPAEDAAAAELPGARSDPPPQQQPQQQQQQPQQQSRAEADGEQEARGASGGKREAAEAPAPQPDPKRPRAAPCGLGTAAERLGAAAELARKALLQEESAASGEGGADTSRFGDLVAAGKDAAKELRAAERQCRAEQASLVASKAKLRSLQAAQEKASRAEDESGPLVEGLERVAAEVSEACGHTAKAAAAAAAAQGGAGSLEAAARSVGEPRLDAACARLAEARRRAAELSEERAGAEAAREEAKARLAALEELREEMRRQAAAEAAARAAEAEAAEFSKDADAMEVEVAWLRAAAESAPKPEAAEQGREQAAGPAGAGGEQPGTEQAAAAEGEEAPAGAAQAKYLASLKQRVEELHQSCEEQSNVIAELEAKCASVPGGAAAAAAAAAAVGAKREAEGAGAGALPLDTAKPGAFLAARAAQRLVVSTEDAPEVAGEYRLVPGGANGCPAYKASGPRQAFLLWTPCEGGCWIFAPDLAGTDAILARSLQLAWTSLPDEIMAGSWTRSAWGERGGRARIAVLRG